MIGKWKQGQRLTYTPLFKGKKALWRDYLGRHLHAGFKELGVILSSWYRRAFMQISHKGADLSFCHETRKEKHRKELSGSSLDDENQMLLNNSTVARTDCSLLRSKGKKNAKAQTVKDTQYVFNTVGVSKKMSPSLDSFSNRWTAAVTLQSVALCSFII